MKRQKLLKGKSMKLTSCAVTLLLTGSLTALVACGSSDDDDKDDDPTTYETTIPQIAFTVAITTDAELKLAAKDDEMLTDRVERINKDIESVNDDLARANKEYAFSEPGEITGKGDDGKESGSFAEIADGTYERQVVICHDGKVQIIVKWSVDGKNIYTERDLNQKPDKPEDVKVKTVFEDDTDKTLVSQFYGVPAGVPDDADGTQLAAWDEAKQLADGGYTFRGVSDFFNDGAELGADEYITGAVDAASAGSFVGYSARATSCDGVTFNEADPTDTWCSSRQIGADTWFTAAESAAAWTDTLKPIGVAARSNLGAPDLDATCPAEPGA